MTEKHQLLTDLEFEDQFKNCTLAPILFTHEAHLRLTYIYITKYGLKKAIKNLCVQIENFDKKFGDGHKFNAEITAVSAEVVNYFINKDKALDFKGLLEEFPKLKDNFLSLVKAYNKRKVLNDPNRVELVIEPNNLIFNYS